MKTKDRIVKSTDPSVTCLHHVPTYPFQELTLKILLLALFSGLVLCGCSSAIHEAPIELQPYDQATTARIRLFGNNGLPAAINPGQDCTSSKKPILAYGYTVADKVNSTLGRHTMRSVGMPASWKSDNLSYGESYSEFVIPAGEPTVLLLKMSTEQLSCVPPRLTFVPEAGKDYEAYLERHDGRCGTMIQLLSQLEKPGPNAQIRSSSCGGR